MFVDDLGTAGGGERPSCVASMRSRWSRELMEVELDGLFLELAYLNSIISA